MVKPKAVALVSGGLDSTVALAEALTSYDVVLGLMAHYGQPAEAMERKAVTALLAYYNIPFHRVALPWLAELLPEGFKIASNSASKSVIGSEHPKNKEYHVSPTSLSAVWVPNRNGVLLNIAAAYAESLGAEAVIFGANADEAVTFSDNTVEFCHTVTQSLSLSTQNKVRVLAPVATLSKAEILEHGLELNVPFNNLWSCYGVGPLHCGQCSSCQYLKTALTQASTGEASIEISDLVVFDA